MLSSKMHALAAWLDTAAQAGGQSDEVLSIAAAQVRSIAEQAAEQEQSGGPIDLEPVPAWMAGGRLQ